MISRTLILLFIITSIIHAQENTYFQQDVDYTINITIDVEAYTYKGSEQLIYTNNSPDVLNFIWVHLYPNAYKDNSTPFARQEASRNRRTYHFAPKEDHGYININSLKEGKQELNWEYKSDALDEIKIFLNSSLQPGQSVTLQFEFDAKFPKVFSRMGHTGKVYFAGTQWYPKAVVYDRFGWHPDSYLDKGEFYGEFGNFDVSITLPKNFIIDATGSLQENPQEKAFMDSIIADTKELITIKDEDERESFYKKWQNQHKAKTNYDSLKTVRFKAENVHDFAWFAGEGLMIHQARNKNNVLTNVLVRPKNAYGWKDVTEYVRKTLWFYGMRAGAYQYPKASVVDGSLAAGAGMEYPMITVISIGNISYAHILEMVVMHEVGHNWFYGMLGSDERAAPFLDEGINQFHEKEYMEHYYGFRNLSVFDSLLGDWNVLSDLGEWHLNQLTYGGVARQHIDQPLNLRAEEYTISNYGSVVYMKSAAMLTALQWEIGKDTFIKAIQSYFEQWNGKHPTVDDFWNSIEKFSGRDFKHFRKEWMTTTHYSDFNLAGKETIKTKNGYETTMFVENDGSMQGVATPVNIITTKGDTLEARWNGDPKQPVVIVHKDPAKRVEINLNRVIYESSYWNNASFPKLEFTFLDIIPSWQTYKFTFMPYLGYEYFEDGIRAGLGFYSGNPVTRQHFFRANTYVGTSSGAIGYSARYTNRLPGFALNYSDLSAGIKDGDGLRHLSGSLKSIYKPRDDTRFSFDTDLSVHHINLYNLVYNEPGIFQAGTYSVTRFTFNQRMRRMLWQESFGFKAEKSFDAGNSPFTYTKTEIAAKYVRFFSKKLFIITDFYFGRVWGNTAPTQELIYAGGFVDPKHETFIPFRRGDFSALKDFNSAGKIGMNMLGYTHKQGAFFRGKAGAATGLVIKLPSMFAVYGRAALLANDTANLFKQDVFSEAGLKMNIGPLSFTFPFYISDPFPGDDNLEFRWSMSFKMPSLLGI
jgi:Peptidase family M1 domain